MKRIARWLRLAADTLDPPRAQEVTGLWWTSSVPEAVVSEAAACKVGR